MAEKFVIPMESNPDVLNKFLAKIGVSEDFKLIDVYGLESDTLDFLPKPIVAFILLFPCSSNYENHRKEEDEELKANPSKAPEGLFYMKQFLHNACCTIALFHAVLNNTNTIELKDGALKNFYEKAKDLSPEERGHLLEGDQDIIKIHQSLAVEGQTEAPSAEENVLFHFVALTNVGDNLMELDGRKNFPINHGKTSTETFVNDAAAVCKKFMRRDEKELRFTVIALAASGEQ
ncbi:hypothetical protein PVAND_002778 [Polypedilum vanderplanki]|uniref:Ubiquitin carboxyl-terminal hydrolase n=1 Tax=Polypedilum vanderplanki TaxID=319348 RepID=A0A9J6BT59_POLVA|nr:hypothetical protein PVAND_002778 [Polypedilum vanderplanki]